MLYRSRVSKFKDFYDNFPAACLLKWWRFVFPDCRRMLFEVFRKAPNGNDFLLLDLSKRTCRRLNIEHPNIFSQTEYSRRIELSWEFPVLYWHGYFSKLISLIAATRLTISSVWTSYGCTNISSKSISKQTPTSGISATNSLLQCVHHTERSVDIKHGSLLSSDIKEIEIKL